MTFVKLVFNMSDKPKLIEALMLTICCKPDGLKCSFRLIRSTTCLNKIKSAFFWVIKGYFSKWSMIHVKSFREETEYVTLSLPS